MKSQIETLETRRLMAGDWAIADEFQLAAGQTSASTAMATDPAGNVFAAGFVTDATGATHDVIREKPAGTTAWTTVWQGDLPLDQINELAVEADGDIYVGGATPTGDYWMVMAMRCSRGETTFSVTDDPGATDGFAFLNALTVDQATGNVFAVGRTRMQVGVTTAPGKKTSPVYASGWIVRKQTGGDGAFQTVDTFTSNLQRAEAFDVSVVPTGPLAGVYVVGSMANETSWLMRRSSGTGGAVGNAGTWSTFDTFQYDAVNGGFNSSTMVAADAAGNLYVAGTGSVRTTSGTRKTPTYTTTYYWVTRKYAFDATRNGYAWTTLEAFDSTNVGPIRDLAVGGDGSIYLVGNYQDRNQYGTLTDYHAVTRSYRNVNGTWQWQTDDYQFVADRDTVWTGVVVDPTGTAYVGGGGRGDDGGYHWIVRSTANATATSISSSSTPQEAATWSSARAAGLFSEDPLFALA
jgi:hypothetical protein